MHPLTGDVIQLLGIGTLIECQYPMGIHALRLAQPVLDIVIDLHSRTAGGLILDRLVTLPHILQHQWIIALWLEHGAGIGDLFGINDIGNQHRVMSGHGPA